MHELSILMNISISRKKNPRVAAALQSKRFSFESARSPEWSHKHWLRRTNSRANAPLSKKPN